MYLTNSFARGDRVLYQQDGSENWTPGRVIGEDSPISVKIATSLTCMRQEGNRYLPVGTPVYDNVWPEKVHLTDRDPDWNPYEVKPFMTPPEYAVLGGVPGFSRPGMPGLSHVGAYLPGGDYDEGDPAWVWEADDGWRRAIVIHGQPSWVSVRHVDGYRLPDGASSKSYRPAKVWPVICDHPDVPKRIEVPEKWSRVADLGLAQLVMQQLGSIVGLGRHPGL